MIWRAVKSSWRNFWWATGSVSLSGMGSVRTYLTLLSEKTKSRLRFQMRK